MADQNIIVNFGAIFTQLDSFMDDESDVALQLVSGNYKVSVLKLIQNMKRPYLPKIMGYAENIIFPSFITEDFRTHFRVSKEIFQIVLDKIADKLIVSHAGGYNQITPHKQLLVFLCYMANQESLREVGQYFGLGISTVHKCLRRVLDAFNSNLMNVIKWPSAFEQAVIARENQLVHRLPGIVGALDGTHIRLSSCLNQDSDYINRKGFPSMQLQLVVDNKMLITNAYTGWPGCAHDARILRNSSLYDMAESGNLLAPDKVIIADSAYPLRSWMVTPFRDTGHLNAQQKKFNKAISSCRQIVERTIGHIKGRFRRLKEVTLHEPNIIASLIISGCILHNLCVLNHEDIENYIDDGNEENNHPNRYQNIFRNALAGQARRTQLMNHLL